MTLNGMAQIIKDPTRKNFRYANLNRSYSYKQTYRGWSYSLWYCDHDLTYIIRYTRISKIKNEPKVLTVRTHKKNLREASFKQMRNKVNYSLRKLRSDYYARKIEEIKINLRNAWKILKSVINETSKCSSI